MQRNKEGEYRAGASFHSKRLVQNVSYGEERAVYCSAGSFANPPLPAAMQLSPAVCQRATSLCHSLQNLSTVSKPSNFMLVGKKREGLRIWSKYLMGVKRRLRDADWCIVPSCQLSSLLLCLYTLFSDGPIPVLFFLHKNTAYPHLVSPKEGHFSCLHLWPACNRKGRAIC